MFTRHPWVVQALASHVLYGPGKARHDDHSLGVYEAAGFTGAEADQATAGVFMFVLGNALGESSTASLARKFNRMGDDAGERLRETMAQAAEIGRRFPRLRSRLEDTSAQRYGAAPESSFEFGLRALLDGLEARLGTPHPRLSR
jgi:hypothetical protein